MIAISFLCWTRVLMNASGMSTTATYLCYYESMMYVSSTDYVATVGELAYYLKIKYLCLLPPSTVLPLMFPSIFYFRNRWDSSVCFFWSCDMLFQCSWRKLSLMCSCFISEWISDLPLLPHHLRHVLSSSWVMMDPTTSGSCIVIPWLKNMWDSRCNMPMFSIGVSAYEYLIPGRLGGCRTWYDSSLLWICTLMVCRV